MSNEKTQENAGPGVDTDETNDNLQLAVIKSPASGGDEDVIDAEYVETPSGGVTEGLFAPTEVPEVVHVYDGPIGEDGRVSMTSPLKAAWQGIGLVWKGLVREQSAVAQARADKKAGKQLASQHGKEARIAVREPFDLAIDEKKAELARLQAEIRRLKAGRSVARGDKWQARRMRLGAQVQALPEVIGQVRGEKKAVAKGYNDRVKQIGAGERTAAIREAGVVVGDVVRVVKDDTVIAARKGTDVAVKGTAATVAVAPGAFAGAIVGIFQGAKEAATRAIAAVDKAGIDPNSPAAVAKRLAERQAAAGGQAPAPAEATPAEAPVTENQAPEAAQDDPQP